MARVRWMAVLLFAVGCATGGPVHTPRRAEAREHRPLSVPAASPVEVRWRKLKVLALEERWHLETFDETRGILIALRPSKEGSDTREHVRVVLRADATEIGIETEVLENGAWERDAGGDDAHARETEIALRVDRTATAARPVR